MGVAAGAAGATGGLGGWIQYTGYLRWMLFVMSATEMARVEERRTTGMKYHPRARTSGSTAARSAVAPVRYVCQRAD